MNQKVFVFIVADGAPDRLRINGKSPLELAETPWLDRLTREGYTGLMQTLYPDLQKGSVVAQLGMLGYDPYRYGKDGRAYYEALSAGIAVNDDDLIFRANLVSYSDGQLISYNAGYIRTEQAASVIRQLDDKIRTRFPGFELHHTSDFRNLLIARNAGCNPYLFQCPEPHESEGRFLPLEDLVKANDEPAKTLAARINELVRFAYDELKESPADTIFPWSPSAPVVLPEFSSQSGVEGKSCIIGNMDFLAGFAKAMKIDFVMTGNGNWDTDYTAKGRELMKKIAEGYSFIYVHINGPDEASHMNDAGKKIYSIEQIDAHILRPVMEYFTAQPGQLGAVCYAPDHYTNINTGPEAINRVDAHSDDPVPFAVWNGTQKDEASRFSEEEIYRLHLSGGIIGHLDLLTYAGVRKSNAPVVKVRYTATAE